jgi:hypothetical protein
MDNTCCPKSKHDERRDQQNYARYLKRLTSGGLSYIDGFGVYDPTPPEAVKLIKAEIELIKQSEVNNDD